MSGDIPLFSIITPVYNGARYLPDLIDSVQAQTYQDYEHIIFDDGSTDDGATVSVIKRYADADPRIRWWTRENKGQYATQNEAIEAAKGLFILVISADDRLYDNAVLHDIADHIAHHPAHDVIYGKTAHTDESNHLLPSKLLIWSPSKWLIKHFVYAQHCSLFVKRTMLIDNDIRFDASLHYTGDWDWLIRVFDTTDQIGYLKRFIGTIRMHPAQTSRQAKKAEIEQEHRLISQRYGGSYRIHTIITWANNYRAMALIALNMLKTQGVGATLNRIRERHLPRKD